MFSISLNFNGNCKEAITFYANVFKQENPTFLTYGELDTSFDPNVQMSEEGKNRIANVQLNIGGTIVTFCDMPDNFEFINGNNLTLCVGFSDFAEATRVFNELTENGGMVFVPLTQENPAYSLLADQFGINWNISCIDM